MERLRVEVLTAAEVDASLLTVIRALVDAAFDDFGDEDWDHARGGWHVLVRYDRDVVAHAAVVERTLVAGERSRRTAYVEAVAPDHQGRGLGSVVMGAVARLIRERFELGALSTGRPSFYERLGWERWLGPTSVRLAAGGLLRTPDEDGGILVLQVGDDLDRTLPISCGERTGDDW